MLEISNYFKGLRLRCGEVGLTTRQRKTASNKSGTSKMTTPTTLSTSLPGFPAADHTAAPGLLSAASLLTTLWPDPISRPSLRWIREMQAKRALPFIKIGHLVFFEIERVRAALRKFEVSCR